MKTCVTLILGGLLILAANSFAQASEERFEIEGKVTVLGTVTKAGEEFQIQVGTLTFTLDRLSPTDAALVGQNVEKGLAIKGNLRTKQTKKGMALTIESTEIRPGVDGFLDAKAEGEVRLRGLLTKDLPRLGDSRISHDMKPDAYVMHTISHRSFSAVLFKGDVAKKAESLYGRNVFMKCRFELRSPGSRSECLFFTLDDVERDTK